MPSETSPFSTHLQNTISQKKATRGPLVVHIGFHRCGSTAVQNCLSRVRTDLTKNGYQVYLRARPEAQPLLRNMRKLNWPDFWMLTGLWRFMRIVLTFRRHQGPIIVSDENIPGLMPGTKGNQIYPFMGRVLKQLQLIAFFSGRALKIVTVKREEKAWRNSVWAFRRLKGETRSRDLFLQALSGSLSSALERIEKLPEHQVTLLDIDTLSAGSIHDAFALPSQVKLDLQVSNKSLSDLALKIIATVYNSGTPENQKYARKKLRRLLENVVEEEDVDWPAANDILVEAGYPPFKPLK